MVPGRLVLWRGGVMRTLLAIGAVATLSAAGPPPPVLRGGAPRVSPDGKHIAFLAERDSLGAQVWVIGVDGRDERQLTRGAPDKDWPRWSADGAVVFSTFERDSGRLFAIGADGSGLRQLVAVPGRNPVLVDGGRRVLYSTGGWATMQLSTSALDGSEPTPVTHGVGAVWNATVSPDGARIAYTLSDSTRQLQVWVIGADGTGAHALTHFSSADGRPQCPDWSADGTRIAFQVNGVDPGNRLIHVCDLWVMDLASGALSRLHTRTGPWLDEVPRWFPDGEHIAFQSDRTGQMQVWVAGADGSGARQVTR